MSSVNERAVASAAARRGLDLNAEVQALQQMIRRSGQRWRRLVLLEALGLAIAAPLGYLWLTFAFDALFHLSTGGRWLASVILLLVVGWLAWRLWRSWQRANFSDARVALALERNTPGGVENRLINSVQLATDGSQLPAALRAALVRENRDRLRQIHVTQVAASRPAVIRILLAAVAISIGVGLRLWQPERFNAAATRILLPFSAVEPTYRTRLKVVPGDVTLERGSDLVVTISIEGEVPRHLLLITREEGVRMSTELRVPPGAASVTHRLSNVRTTRSYAVRGGDYVSPFYTITVPLPAAIRRFRTSFRYPAYTGLAARTQEGTSGDLEAVCGTTARLHLTTDRPLATLELLCSAAEQGSSAPVVRHELERVSATEFTTEIEFKETQRYQVELVEQGREASGSRYYTLTALEDRPPDVQLFGLADGDSVTEETVQALQLTARDDFGLAEVGLFVRIREASDTPWELLKSWRVAGNKLDFNEEWIFALAATGAAEGDVVELSPRGRDHHPERSGTWSGDQVVTLSVGGDDARLQIEYAKILATEQGLGELSNALQEAAGGVERLARRLDSGVLGRLDDRQTVERLGSEVKPLAAAQSGLRNRTAALARDMPEGAGSLKQSVALIADSELVRSIRALESALTREEPRQRQAGLGESRITLERVGRNLQELRLGFTAYREGWEAEHMVAYTEMAGVRQMRLAEASLRYASLPAAAVTSRVRQGGGRRQERAAELATLAGKAFSGLAQRVAGDAATLAAAYSRAAAALTGQPLQGLQERARREIGSGNWEAAATAQQAAAAAIANVVEQLAEAQAAVAREMLAKLNELARDDAAAQAALKSLQAGSATLALEGKFSGTEVSELIALAAEMEKRRFEERLPDLPSPFEGKLSDITKGHIKGTIDQEQERDFSIMKLAKAPSAEMEIAEGFETSDKLDFSIIENYEDVVGELLDEADDMRDSYESIQNLMMGQDIEAGSPGKGSLSMASASAAAPTGNMKPDTKEHGGVSRIGRQGARASGIAAGDESINRRGRDEAQESSQEVPDVAGAIRERLSEDPAADHSTGVGGRTVEGDLQKSFSVKDAGEWRDEMAERGEAPQTTYQIVERKGPPLSPEVAERLRAMESQQEQMLSRIKQIKKELDNLFLPTEALDEASRRLSAAMDRLRQQPDAEAFRQQIEALEKLMGAVMVFDRPETAFQPSLPREQLLRGKVLDESPNPPLPGYEERIKRYYERLAAP